MACIVVEAGDVTQLTSRVRDLFGEADADFLQRFEAIDREARAQHLHVPDAGRGKLGQHLLGVRLQPARAADLRLERHDQLVFGQPEPFAQAPGRRLALAEIRIARAEIALRNAVEGQQQARCARMLPPVRLDAARERLDVA